MPRTAVTPTALSPQQIRDPYHLDADLSLLVTQPALVAVLPVSRHDRSSFYALSIFPATL
ncbi:hypothetical protein EPA93_02815 [Ktedonosporobacter rubrisoli]|uniref:Uncharacterized protein n=1 Tax=Ktedonosporobacter rubrisoli TaxID=2509675 RepID=A0A4P6JJ84_KTERU|nr:hypothetical protein [Ktedonosporobacter rubrisoli]QBD74980.1 hypothetical protein EPA93_02815 [Ktedonosporobacter rubrisoli]